MKRFAVDWLEDALDELADAWSTAENRDAVNLAVDAIDEKLAEKPNRVQRSHERGTLFLHRAAVANRLYRRQSFADGKSRWPEDAAVRATWVSLLCAQKRNATFGNKGAP